MPTWTVYLALYVVASMALVELGERIGKHRLSPAAWMVCVLTWPLWLLFFQLRKLARIGR